MLDRRKFFTRSAQTAAQITAASAAIPVAHSVKDWFWDWFTIHGHRSPIIATNTYPWSTFAKRRGEPFELHTDQLMADIAGTGFTGYEPIIESIDEFDGMADRLQTHGLSMPSLYVNSLLHDPSQSSASIDHVINIAEHAKKLVGTQIILTNPVPIRWGGDEDKDDQQLIHQAQSLNKLGEALTKMGMTLAYHNHDSELRQGAREFHHMLTGTDPQNVKFCLDAHWVYRGCGNSQVALFDTIQLYCDRIVELHLRQSVNGIWTETFSLDGDIDYRRLFKILSDRGITPLLVLEQSIEDDSPNTVGVIEAHRISLANLKQHLD